MEAEVVTKWKEIVGRRLAEQTYPLRVTYKKGDRNSGTLHILVESGFAVELQHIEPILVERINTYYGYSAISRLAIRQGRLPKSKKRRATEPPPLDERGEKELQTLTSGTKTGDLKEALESLGRQVMASGGKKPGRRNDS